MKFSERQIKKAIKNSSGILTYVLTSLNEGRPLSRQITYQGLKQRINENKELVELLDNERDSLDDIAEDSFINAIKNKETWAIKEWIKGRGHKRGYIPYKEASIKVSETLQTSNLDYLKEEGLEEFVKSLNNKIAMLERSKANKYGNLSSTEIYTLWLKQLVRAKESQMSSDRIALLKEFSSSL